MATWHQKRNPVKLYSTTKYNVVVDSNNGQCIVQFDTSDQAQAYVAAVQRNRPDERAYILPPKK